MLGNRKVFSMDNPFELMIWAIAVAFAWLMFASITGIDDWLKKMIGRKNPVAELAAKIDALEKRLAQIEDRERRDLIRASLGLFLQSHSFK